MKSLDSCFTPDSNTDKNYKEDSSYGFYESLDDDTSENTSSSFESLAQFDLPVEDIYRYSDNFFSVELLRGNQNLDVVLFYP